MSPLRASALVAGLLIAGLASAPGAAIAHRATRAPERAATLTTAQFEARLLELTNARRTTIGCPTFTRNTALVKAARTHTLRMVQTGSFSHQVPHEAGLAARIVSAGYYKHWQALAENIAWGQGSSPATVFDMWMHSAPHRANLQNCHLRDIGYGVRYSGGSVWVTGDFGRH